MCISARLSPGSAGPVHCAILWNRWVSGTVEELGDLQLSTAPKEPLNVLWTFIGRPLNFVVHQCLCVQFSVWAVTRET